MIPEQWDSAAGQDLPHCLINSTSIRVSYQSHKIFRHIKECPANFLLDKQILVLTESWSARFASLMANPPQPTTLVCNECVWGTRTARLAQVQYWWRARVSRNQGSYFTAGKQRTEVSHQHTLEWSKKCSRAWLEKRGEINIWTQPTWETDTAEELWSQTWDVTHATGWSFKEHTRNKAKDCSVSFVLQDVSNDSVVHCQWCHSEKFIQLFIIAQELFINWQTKGDVSFTT